MKLELIRIAQDKESTMGYMKIDGQFECFCLEDQDQVIKVMEETRIPAGSYRLELRKVESPKTMSYREKYPWFKWHIQIMNVPDFKYVYIHIGNTDDDTNGCILLGDSLVSKGSSGDFIGSSGVAFERFYRRVEEVLRYGHEPVTINITDP